MTPPPAPLALRPHLARGDVRHARRRPVAHAFAYPTFFLVLPLRALAATPDRALARNRFAPLAFHDRDHGDGGPDALAWIEALLLREGVGDVDGEIWLHAVPRVFGYAFKPVSFWHCRRRDGTTAAVVAEVNNTFGERHCYLLRAGSGADLDGGGEVRAAKVFHVSPFCRVDGDYRFRFLWRGLRTVARIDHHDSADSGDGKALLETSVSGVLEPLTRAVVRRALLAMPFLTLGIVARIHWQALRLWWRRVPLISKPDTPPPLPEGRLR